MRYFEKQSFRFGQPKTDLERIMSHYKITKEEAQKMLDKKPLKEILPSRGTGRE